MEIKTDKTELGDIESKITISVILPVYNVEPWIADCIESLKKQSLSGLEFIFVDDCSTDGSMDVVEEWAKADDRVHVIYNNENIGAGLSRNKGIKIAQGEYIAFADPDDYMSLDFYELLYNKAIERKHDIVKGSVLDLKTDGTIVPNNGLNNNIKNKLDNRPLYYMFGHEHWSAIYHRDLFLDGQVKYGSSRCSEDSLFLLSICNKTDSIGFESRAEYYYRNREGSLYHTFDENRFFADLDSMDEKVDYMLENMEIDDNAYGYIAKKGYAYWTNYMKALAEESSLKRIRKEYEDRLIQTLSRLPKRNSDKPLREDYFIRALVKQGVLIYKKPFYRRIVGRTIIIYSHLKRMVEYKLSSNESKVRNSEHVVQMKERMLNNPLHTKEDYMQFAQELLNPLYIYYEKGKSSIKLPNAVRATYGSHEANIESFSRPLWALAFIANENETLRRKLVDMIKKGTNPAGPEYWGKVDGNSQIVVEVPAIAWFLFIHRTYIKERLSIEECQRIASWLHGANCGITRENNWQFFGLIVDAILLSMGWGGDREELLARWSIVDSHYLGDGWYSDGKTNRKDYYVAFGYHFYSLLWLYIDDKISEEIKNKIVQRAEEFAKSFFMFIDDTGEVIPFGRSLTYRFAQVAFWSAYKLAGLKGFSNAEVKGIINRNLKWWVKKDIYHPNGLLNVGYAYKNSHVRDPYNATGSPYWALKVFVLLQLGDDDSFWQEEAQQEKEQGKIQMYIPGPQFYVAKDKGISFLYPTELECNKKRWKGIVQKYEKYAYATGFGFCVPVGNSFIGVAADSSLCISEDGETWTVKEQSNDIVQSENSYLSIWKPNGRIKITSRIIIDHAWHYRVHTIETNTTLEWRDCGFCVPIESELSGDFVEKIESENNKEILTLKNSEEGLFSAVVSTSDKYKTNYYEAPHNSNIIWRDIRIPYIGGTLTPGEHRIVNAFYGGRVPASERPEKP